MIDFHNHILPNVDDGAKTIEESIQMLKIAQNQGITDVVSTVHFQHPKMEGMNTDFNYISNIKDNLVSRLKEYNVKIKIHIGAEVFFNFNLLDITENKLTTFGNKKYMLIEFQTYQFPKDFDKHLFELAIAGITPIIAHPERYKDVQSNVEIIEKLIGAGCLVQIDAGSLINHFGYKCMQAAQTMLKMNMVHIIGSDAHNMGRRNFCLKEAQTEASKFSNYDVSILVNDNPKRVINGEGVNPFDIIGIKRKTFLSRFFLK